MSQRSTRRRLRVEQKALRHSVRGAVHLSMRRVLGMHRSSTTSALEPSASVISLCQSSSFGHAQSCTGCLASPQFVRSRNRSGEPRHDHPHELASRIQRRRLASSVPTRVREQCQSPADADETPHCLQLHRSVPGTLAPCGAGYRGVGSSGWIDRGKAVGRQGRRLIILRTRPSRCHNPASRRHDILPERLLLPSPQ